MRSLGKLFQIFILEGKNELRYEFTLVLHKLVLKDCCLFKGVILSMFEKLQNGEKSKSLPSDLRSNAHRTMMTV